MAKQILRGAKAQEKAWAYLTRCGGGWQNALVKESGVGTAVWRALVDRGLAERSEKGGYVLRMHLRRVGLERKQGLN